MKLSSLILMSLLLVTLAACNRGEVTDVQRNPEGGVDVTVRLTETEVNEAITDALNAAANPLLRDPSVDLQAGQIVINGQHERRDGGGTVSGSLTVTVTVEGGALLAQVTQADIEGWDASNERIAQFNQRLAENFSRRANRDNQQITVTAVNITDTELEVTFNAKRS